MHYEPAGVQEGARPSWAICKHHNGRPVNHAPTPLSEHRHSPLQSPGSSGVPLKASVPVLRIHHCHTTIRTLALLDNPDTRHFHCHNYRRVCIHLYQYGNAPMNEGIRRLWWSRFSPCWGASFFRDTPRIDAVITIVHLTDFGPLCTHSGHPAIWGECAVLVHNGRWS